MKSIHDVIIQNFRNLAAFKAPTSEASCSQTSQTIKNKQSRHFRKIIVTKLLALGSFEMETEP